MVLKHQLTINKGVNMNKSFNDYYEHRICGHYVSALINGDYSGLGSAEIRDFDNWFNTVHIVGSVYDVHSDESEFALCEVSELHGEVEVIRQYFNNAEVTA